MTKAELVIEVEGLHADQSWLDVRDERPEEAQVSLSVNTGDEVATLWSRVCSYSHFLALTHVLGVEHDEVEFERMEDNEGWWHERQTYRKAGK